jgi:hypothetical protein
MLLGDPDWKAVDLPRQLEYVSGEVSFFYGRSLGNSDREIKQGSFLSQMVNGNTQILVGGSYGRSSGHVPRPTGW